MSNDLWIILTAVLTSAACALAGSLLVLRKQAMLGDAISHAVLPGIAIAFLVTQSRQSVPMLIGAGLIGLLTVVMIEWLRERHYVRSDAAIGVVFTGLFAIGVILISLFGRSVDLDQDCVLFGEIAFIPFDRWITATGFDLGPKAIWSSAGALILNLLYISLFWKELKLTSFDPLLANSLGIKTRRISYGLIGCVSFTAVAAFESVGAILVVAMLVVPAATAYLLSVRLHQMLMGAIICGTVASVTGFYAAAAVDASIAAMIAVVAGLIFTLTLGSVLVRRRLHSTSVSARAQQAG